VNLPDFSRVLAFIELRDQMGALEIAQLPEVEFVRTKEEQHEVVEVDKDDQQLQVDLAGRGRKASKSELKADKNGLLTYKGRKVAAYIRDQRWNVDVETKTSTYRFHLLDCSTMQSMRDVGRERRYLATQRSDGHFEVNYEQEWGGKSRKQTADFKLTLCYNCQVLLRQKNLFFEPFNLKRFFDRHDSSVPKTVRRIETVTTRQDYQPDHDELAKAYKEKADHTCQKCNVVCPAGGGLLNLHHCNGDPSDNRHSNLRVLCLLCHSNEPYHGQVGRTTSARRNMERLQQLRKKQNIT